MAKTDLVFIHAPSYFDFRKHICLFGPIADLIPSSPVYEMYPIGFTTMAEYLERHGFRVRIHNLAVQMLRSSRFDPRKRLAKLEPLMFGLDLHWLPHAHGSLAVAALLKELHPQIPIVFGGFSATHFHLELLDYPQVDYVLRGDSCEGPLLELMRHVKDEPGALSLSELPSLTYRNQGQIKANPMATPPADLDDLRLDYSMVFRTAARYHDISGQLPFKNFMQYPITAALSVRGCTHGCRTCGGSASAFKRLHGRNTPAYRSPEKLAQDIRSIGELSRGPVFVLGDLVQAGEEYVDRFCQAVEGHPGPVTMEFFDAARPRIVERLAAALTGLTLQVSMESHDPEVRRAFGRARYTNAAMEQLMETAFTAGVSRLDLFFMTGLPRQDQASVMATVEYAGELMERFQKHVSEGPTPLVPFISPLAPFLDPGSQVFTHPERHGYKLLYRTLEEHRQALQQPSWKLMLNYRTKWMSRQELVEASYEGLARLREYKARHGLATPEEVTLTRELVREALELTSLIDEAMALSGEAARRARLEGLAPRIQLLNGSNERFKRKIEVEYSRGPHGLAWNIGRLGGGFLKSLRPGRK